MECHVERRPPDTRPCRSGLYTEDYSATAHNNLGQRLEISWHKSGIFLRFLQWYTGVLSIRRRLWGEAHCRQELCEQVWPQQFISDAVLESTVKALRQAIGDSRRRQQLIQTVPVSLPGVLDAERRQQTSLGKVREVLKSTPMPNTHISRSATPPLLLCLQAAARFLGRPQLLTRA
jgi:hypothetical protein